MNIRLSLKRDKFWEQPIDLGTMGEAVAVSMLYGLHDDKAQLTPGEVLSDVVNVMGHSLQEIDDSVDGHEFIRRVTLMMAEEELRLAKSKSQKLMYKSFIQSLKEVKK